MLQNPSARLAALVYFVQGALGITAVALPLYLKDLGYTVSQIAYLTSISAFPWFLKIIYGAISDSIPILGMRRKPYIFLSSILSTAGWLILSLKPTSFFEIIAVLSIVNTGFAATDVITDGLIVEKSTKENVGKYQSLAWGSRSVGAIFSGLLGGYLAKTMPYHQVFAIAAILPMIIAIVSLFVREEKTTKKEGVIWQPIWESLKLLFTTKLSIFAIILSIGAISASFNTPYFFYLKEQLKLSEDVLGFLSSLSWFGAVMGALIFGKFLSRFKLTKLMIVGVIINVFNTIACLWVYNLTSAAIIFLISGVLAYITFLPFLATAAKLTHGSGVEGCLFALLMSVHNLGTIVSGIIGGAVFPLIGLSMLIVITGLMGLVAIPFILKLKDVG